MRDLPHRYAQFLTDHSRAVLLVMVVLTVIVGAGNVLGTHVKADIGEAEMASNEQAALDEIAATYAAKDLVEAKIVVRERGGNVLTRDSLLTSLYLQRDLLNQPALVATLHGGTDVMGIENLVARVAVAEDQRPADAALPITRRMPLKAPPLAAQIAAFEARTEAQINALVKLVVDPATVIPDSNPGQFLPRSYEPGDLTAEARVTRIFQKNPHGMAISLEAIHAAQRAIDVRARAAFDDAFVHGEGITRGASTRAVGDSFKLITPVALLLLIVVLTAVFRDVADIVMSLVAITVVIVCLKGVQGWCAIPATSILIAVPFMLIALGIDYALHVVMRFREAREGVPDTEQAPGDRRNPDGAMQVALGAVLLILVTAALTTAIGFLSNVFSPLRSIRDFGVLSGAGIVITLVVFTTLLPAMKLEVERYFHRRGRERRKLALGLRIGGLNRVLVATAALSRRAPGAVIAVSLLLAGAGLYGGAGINTEFKRADFLPDPPPGWMQWLPKSLAPGDYDVKDNIDYLSNNFRLHGRMVEAQILIHGELTDPAFLPAVEAVAQRATGFGTLVRESPAFLMRMVANGDAVFAAAIAERDDDGDGFPDREVAAIYDLLFKRVPDRAATVIYRNESGEYASARLSIALLLNASAQAIAADVRGIAHRIEDNAPVTAIATGLPVITAVVQTALFETLISGFAITLGVILVLLMAVYGWRRRAPGLGLLMLLPVVTALAWLLGAMAALGLPFNSETVVITSLAIGLGVDYSLHLGERFLSERDQHVDLGAALTATLSGTGGALLGCALTTGCGFGVLALAISPPLQRFGIVTGLSIVFTFLACMVMLPSLLVLRERRLQARVVVEPGG